MQPTEMRGVDVAFQRLQPVALALGESDGELALRQQRRLDLRHRRRLLALAHVDPDHAGALGHLVGLGVHLLRGSPARAAGSACRRSCHRRRTSSRDRRSACRLPRCGRRTARRSDAGSDGPSRRRGPRGRGTRSAARPAASAAAGRRRPRPPRTSPPAASTAASVRPSWCLGRSRVSCSLSIAFVMRSLPARIVGREFAADKPKPSVL